MRKIIAVLFLVITMMISNVFFAYMVGDKIKDEDINECTDNGFTLTLTRFDNVYRIDKRDLVIKEIDLRRISSNFHNAVVGGVFKGEIVNCTLVSETEYDGCLYESFKDNESNNIIRVKTDIDSNVVQEITIIQAGL